jgi:hypothetical protein
MKTAFMCILSHCVIAASNVSNQHYKSMIKSTPRGSLKLAGNPRFVKIRDELGTKVTRGEQAPQRQRH